MKKIIFLLFGWLALLVASCSDDAPVLKTDILESHELFSVNRTLAEAANLAVERANIIYPNNSRGEARSVDFSNVQCVMSKPSRSGIADTLMYILNFNDQQGFAIVSAPRNAIDVLAVVEEGSYDEEKATANSGFQYYLETATEYCQEMADQIKIHDPQYPPIQKPDTFIKVPDDPLAHAIKQVMLDTIIDSYTTAFKMNIAWGQTGIYGSFCPNGIAGCAPVAMAQIITCCNIWANSPHIDYLFPEADIPSEEINWAQLKWHIHKSSYYSTYIPWECHEVDPGSTHKTIGRLLRQIGYDANANYSSPNATSTNTRYFRSVLRKYMPDRPIPDFKSYDVAQAQRDIDKGMLLMVAGNKDSNKGGHAWVADAYRWVQHIEEYRERQSVDDEWSGWIHKTTQYHYNHFVWGWDGYLDGYYAGDVFNVSDETFVRPKYIAVKKFVD